MTFAKNLLFVDNEAHAQMDFAKYDLRIPHLNIEKPGDGFAVSERTSAAVQRGPAVCHCIYSHAKRSVLMALA